MSASSSIEWTDSSWNPVRGCQKISPGCRNCYAATFAERWRGIAGHAYERGFDPRLAPDKLGEPLTWKKPRRVFVNSMSDLFFGGHRTDFAVGEPFPFEYVAAVFGVMAATPRHEYQILTKRPERAEEFFAWLAAETERDGLVGTLHDAMGRFYTALHPEAEHNDDPPTRYARACEFILDEFDGFVDWPLRNVLLGVSVEDRKYGVPRIDVLRRIPWGRRFLSIEPLLEDIGELDLTGISWVIVGGESGPGARPFNVAWARRVVAQCREQSVPVFVKQVGAVVHEDVNPAEQHQGALVRIRLKDRKGGDPNEWPLDLRVREFPR